MKSASILFFILAILVLTVILGGLYPVAVVDGSPIWSRTWRKAEKAAKNFVLAQDRATGEDYAPVLADIGRNTLSFLIEDAILSQEGENLIRGFDRLSRDRMSEAVENAGDLKNASKLVYGLTMPEFQDLVLLPQARRDIAKEILAERQVDFDRWFSEAKKRKKVKIYFAPFTWDGEAVR